jgi:hypothetical protein
MTDPGYEPAWTSLDRELSEAFRLHVIGHQRRELADVHSPSRVIRIQYQTDHQGGATGNAFIRTRRVGHIAHVPDGYETQALLYYVTGAEDLYVVRATELEHLVKEERIPMVRQPVGGVVVRLTSLEKVSTGRLHLREWHGASAAGDVEIRPGMHYENRSFGYTVESILHDQISAVKDDGERIVLSLDLQRRILTNRSQPEPGGRIRPPLDRGTVTRLVDLINFVSQ